ncbi:glycine-rich protein [Streptomyces echinatus]|uniref:glycine-rich protein n=1 Tax=Streptomyces echinatus TaxID=67293 RepID=UPI00379DAC9E
MEHRLPDHHPGREQRRGLTLPGPTTQPERLARMRLIGGQPPHPAPTSTTFGPPSGGGGGGGFWGGGGGGTGNDTGAGGGGGSSFATASATNLSTVANPNTTPRVTISFTPVASLVTTPNRTIPDPPARPSRAPRKSRTRPRQPFRSPWHREVGSTAHRVSTTGPTPRPPCAP